MLCLSQKQQQNLAMHMQQSLQVLQLPILELAEWVKAEIEQNPLLEYTPSSLCVPAAEINESSLCYQPSLFEHLMEQAHHAFNSKEELFIAERIIGNLDEHGFFSTLLDFPQEMDSTVDFVLRSIQTFDPAGVAAPSLRESLLFQLRLKGKEQSRAFFLIDRCFDDLLANRMHLLQKKLKCSIKTLQKILKEEIAALNFYPGLRFRDVPSPIIIPDVFLKKEGDVWTIEVNKDPLPTFKMASNSLTLEEKGFFQPYVTAAKRLTHFIFKRSTTLKALTLYLLKRQEAFFNAASKTFQPLSIREVARELGFHESTIARAISQKYLFSPLGLLSFRSFFKQTPLCGETTPHNGDTLKKNLLAFVENEDKRAPLTDAQLCEKLLQKGFSCTRRTVAKYRHSLQLPIASQRKNYIEARPKHSSD
jgi:RNA polymerase sigma-54 factor